VSFIERNKLWLLPILGVAAAGVLWLNLPASPLVAGEALAAKPEVQETPLEVIAPPAATELQSLGAPAPEANDPEPLLLAGRQPLGLELRLPSRRPVLHRDQWAKLAQAPPQYTPARGASAPMALAPPPTPDFIIDNGKQRSVWIKGKAYPQKAILEPSPGIPQEKATERP